MKENESTRKRKGALDSHIDIQRKKHRVEVYIDPADFQEGIVEMVSVNSLPFTITESSRFRKAVGPLIEALRSDLPVDNYNRKNTRACMIEKSKEIDEALRKIFKNKLMNLKLDCATS